MSALTFAELSNLHQRKRPSPNPFLPYPSPRLTKTFFVESQVDATTQQQKQKNLTIVGQRSITCQQNRTPIIGMEISRDPLITLHSDIL